MSEMWTGVVATNAIHEIAETSKKFFDWIWGLNSKGKIRMMDFAMERSVGRLHWVNCVCRYYFSSKRNAS